MKYDLGYGKLGNGVTVYNRAKEEGGDYMRVAHIAADGKITYRDKKMPASVKAKIEKAAKKIDLKTQRGSSQMESKLNERTFQGKEIAIYDGEDGLTYIEKRGSGYYGYNDEFDFTAKNKRELEQMLRQYGYNLVSGSLDEAVTPKQQTPEQIKAIVDKLKTNQKIQLWYDSSIKKGENWVPVVVGRRSFSKKYNVGKITLRYADAPRASKLFFYDRDGKISLALGNMAARLVAIKTSVNEESYKVAGKRVTLLKGKKSDGTDWKVKFQNGKEVSLSDVLSLIKPFPKGIKEIKFSKAQLNRLGKEYEKIKGDKLPLGASKKLKAFLSMLDKEALEQMRDAKIKFISDEAGKILKKATNESSVNENAFAVIEKNIWRAIQLSKYADGNDYLQKMLFGRVMDSLRGNKHIVTKISNIKTKLGKGSGDITITAKVDVVLPDSAQKGTKNFKYTQSNSKVKGIIESVNEADYKVYHKSFTASADEARKFAEKRGFEIDEDDWQSQIGLGGRNIKSRPSVGKTHNFTVGLLKDGKPQRKALQISVYGMKNGYELNAYIN